MFLRSATVRPSLLSRCLGLPLVLMACCLATAVFALQFNASAIQQRAQASYGARGASNVTAWLEMLAQSRDLPEEQKLRVVNDFWNRHVYGSEDSIVWRQTDYWATPLESLGKGAGDCEDFVIGKYFSLVHMGVPPEKLRLIYVRARIGGMGSSDSIAHMVLGYYPTPDAEPLVLDNISGTIMPAGRRSDLTPVFSFNAQGIYMPGAKPASADRITRWTGLLTRMRAEGFAP